MIWKYVNHVNPNSINPHKVLQWLSPNTSHSVIAQLSQSISTHGKTVLSQDRAWSWGSTLGFGRERPRVRFPRAATRCERFFFLPLPSFFEEIVFISPSPLRPWKIAWVYEYIYMNIYGQVSKKCVNFSEIWIIRSLSDHLHFWPKLRRHYVVYFPKFANKLSLQFIHTSWTKYIDAFICYLRITDRAFMLVPYVYIILHKWPSHWPWSMVQWW